MGTAIGAGVQRWKLQRWRERLVKIAVPISTRVAELAADQERVVQMGHIAHG
jgi:hypothetical protein